jgi:tRNA(Ile2) C34 agmatinyltransferase TiaS
VRSNKATQNQINKCLEIQQKLAEKGAPIPRLGELLVQHGFVEARTVQDILRVQRKDVLLCTNCGKQFNVIGVEPGKTYKCRFCDGIMVTRAQLDTLTAEETAFGFELPTTDGPSP